MSRTRLHVERDPAGGRVRVTRRSTGPQGRGHLAVRVLSAGPAVARVALVAEGALLVAGDAVTLELHVGTGVRLEVVEPAGTVAFDMRGGIATWHASARVEDGGVLVWRAEPFVLATGADVQRDVDVTLTGSGTAVLREVLVLGRVREAGGVLRQRLRAGVDGRPLLAEDLELDGSRPRVGVLGPHRVVDTVTVLGRTLVPSAAPAGAHRLDLDGPGTVVRHLGAATHASPLEPVWRAVAA